MESNIGYQLKEAIVRVKIETKYLKDTEIKVEKLEAVTYCEDCGKTYSTVKYAKICPYCKSEHTYLLTGNEYNIKEIEAM